LDAASTGARIAAVAPSPRGERKAPAASRPLQRPTVVPKPVAAKARPAPRPVPVEKKATAAAVASASEEWEEF
jgi:hypothetical protein